MSDDDDREVLGYVEYDPDGDELDTIDRTICADCANSLSPKPGKKWAVTYNDDAYGRDIPYPECHECGDVMRGTDIKFSGMW